MTIGPAYGRNYTSGKAAKADWEAGKDFVILDIFHGCGRYVSKSDCKAGEFIELRYGKNLDKVTGFKVK